MQISKFIENYNRYLSDGNDKNEALIKVNRELESFSDEENLIDQYKDFFASKDFNLFADYFVNSDKKEFVKEYICLKDYSEKERKVKNLINDFFMSSLCVGVLGLIVSLYNSYIYVYIFTLFQILFIVIIDTDLIKTEYIKNLIHDYVLYYKYISEINAPAFIINNYPDFILCKDKKKKKDYEEKILNNEPIDYSEDISENKKNILLIFYFIQIIECVFVFMSII